MQAVRLQVFVVGGRNLADQEGVTNVATPVYSSKSPQRKSLTMVRLTGILRTLDSARSCMDIDTYWSAQVEASQYWDPYMYAL